MAKRKTFYVPAAIFDGDRSAYAVAVYAYLCFCADQSGVCFPGINTIAAHTGMSRSSVQRALKELEGSGMLRAAATGQPTGSGRVRRGTNRYRILHAPIPADTVPRVTQNTPSVSQRHDPRVTQNREIYNNSKDTMGDVPSVGTIPDGDATGPDAILKNLHLDLFEDKTFSESVEQAIRGMYGMSSLTVNGMRLGADSIRERLSLLTIDHIDFVEKQIKERCEEVTNGERYLMACILNAPVDCMVKTARDMQAYRRGCL